MFNRKSRSLTNTRSGQRMVPRRKQLAVELLETRALLAANPIVSENLLPGSPASEWDIVGVGDTSVQGFATDISVDQGESISFKINDLNLAPYRLDIYRIGYYGGAGARKVATIPSSQTVQTVQPAPLVDAALGLVDAGNWSVSATWAVPATATSGVYIAKVTREDTGGASHIIFVVRDDDGQSNVLFQTADTTWQAYNRWGGNSFYAGPFAGRAYALSYNRPFDTRGTTPKDWFFSSEYATVRWLEQNGYDVSYSTGVDSDRRGNEILEHDVFLSVGHDEYWSQNQRAHVEAARDAGVHMAFLSGNEVYWKTRWQTSIDASGTPYRTLVSYKETWADAKIDPLSETWTGTWRDDRFSPPADGGRPENALTGQLFTVNRGPAGILGTPITVGAEYSQLRFWDNTRVANLQAGQSTTIGDYVLGYEWDEDVDNGFRPAGLFRMSSTTQAVPEKIDTYGRRTPLPGTATHSLTMYRADSGALVFGAGTVYWAWGLDGTHDVVASAADPAIQQATVNLLADMGVQPETLQAGLVFATMSTDVIAPASAIVSLSNNAIFQTGVPVTVSGNASDTGGGAVAGVVVSVDGGATWNRATGGVNWSYSWNPGLAGPTKIYSRAVDDSGNLEPVGEGIDVLVQLSPTSSVGLVAAFSFDEGSGTVVHDSSGNSNDGTVSGALFTAGFSGQSLYFDGINDLVSIADSNSLDLTGNLTLEAWVRPEDLQGSPSIILKERSSNGLAYALYASNSTGKPPSGYVRVGGADVGVAGASALPLNSWSHVAVTFDSQNLQVFVNGVLASQLPAAGPIAATGQPLQIGGNTTFANEYFHGLIDEVRIYNRTLTPAEIRYNMSQPVQGTLDTISPVAAITSPSDGQTVSGDLPINVNASDNIAVSKVTLLLNGAALSESKRSPYQSVLNTRTLPNGSYTLSGRVLDLAGNLASIPDVTFQVVNASDTTPPVVTKQYPRQGQLIGGSLVLSALAYDNAGVAGVRFTVDGTDIGIEDNSLPYRLAWDSTTLSDGNHLISAVARDTAGNTVTQSTTVLVDNTSPAIVNTAPANGANDVPSGATVTVAFSEPIRSSGFQYDLRTSTGAIVVATIQYNEALKQLQLIPTQPLVTNAIYSVNLSGVKDLAGNNLTSASWSFSTSAAVNHASFWNGNAIPAIESENDPSAVELGMRFQSSLNGYVAGIRFYKGVGNSGPHVGSLWADNGQLLGRLTFTSESASGWQQASFESPIAISANTPYVISYFAPNGRYAANSHYFQTDLNSGPLLAQASNSGNSNGLYRYGASSGFPVNSFNATNYWIDVDFTTVLEDTTPPTVVSTNPASGAVDVSLSSNLQATFSESVQPSSISFVLRDSGNNLVPSSTNYDAASGVATLTPNTMLAEATTYTATMSGAQDMAGNTMQLFSWSFTTFNSIDTRPPVLVSHSPATSAVGVPTSANILGTFDESIETASLILTLTGPNNQSVSGLIDYNDGTRTVTFDPVEALLPQTSYAVTLNARDLAGNLSNYSWSFTTEEVVTGASIWNTSTIPGVTSANDTSAVELGLKFSANQGGFISGIRFYKGTLNTGVHTGKLWTSNGSLLGSVTFSNETNSGWQQADFSSPVAVTANTTYVVSYYAPNGRYAVNSSYFTAGGVTNGALTALSNGVAGGNGVYRYGIGGGFPNNSFNASNYWVDVVFTTSSVDETPPALLSQSPSPFATNVAVTSSISATFNEPVQESSISIVLRDANQAIVEASVSYNSEFQTVTLTPNAGLANNTTYTVTLSGVRDTAGNLMATNSWSFTTGAQATDVSLWGPQFTPSVASVNDASAVELGVKFQSDRSGYITGIRFYKGAANTGVHIGNLWSASGSLLASATFASESTSGWQTVMFASPILITANTTYVASYFAPNGGYAFDGNYFASARINGPLRAPASSTSGGNGVYRYGASSGLPTNSFNSANYWVDVLMSETV